MQVDDRSAELSKLAQEIGTLREQVAMVAAALNRIEKRLKLVFPDYTKIGKPVGPAKGVLSDKTREQLLFIFEELLAVARSGGDIPLATKLGSINAVDLVALAYELGVSDKKKIGLPKAKEGIRRRIHESLLLAGNNGRPAITAADVPATPDSRPPRDD